MHFYRLGRVVVPSIVSLWSGFNPISTLVTAKILTDLLNTSSYFYLLL